MKDIHRQGATRQKGMTTSAQLSLVLQTFAGLQLNVEEEEEDKSWKQPKESKEKISFERRTESERKKIKKEKKLYKK